MATLGPVKTTSTGLSVLAGLSAAAMIAIVAAIVCSPHAVQGPSKPPSHLAASEASLAHAGMTPTEQLALMEAVAKSYLQRKDDAQAIAWAQRYVAAGGAEADVRPLLA